MNLLDYFRPPSKDMKIYVPKWPPGEKEHTEVKELMDVTICFGDDEMRSYLQAKACMEEELDDDLCNDECIGRLAEFYLDVKKGEKEVYDTDEVE